MGVFIHDQLKDVTITSIALKLEKPLCHPQWFLSQLKIHPTYHEQNETLHEILFFGCGHLAFTCMLPCKNFGDYCDSSPGTLSTIMLTACSVAWLIL
jgi:hypothetical protein